jgi:hypothetical protein
MSEEFKLYKLPHGENYIKNRIDRFYQEFLMQEHDAEDLEMILALIHDYLLLCDDGSIELTQSVINLRQCIFWFNTWTSNDFES